MSDERLRQLERRWKESGSVFDEAAYLKERVRVGDLKQEGLSLAAYVGHPAALHAIGSMPVTGCPVGTKNCPWHHPVSGWVWGLRTWGEDVLIRAAVVIVRACAMTYLERHRLAEERREQLRERPSTLNVELEVALAVGRASAVMDYVMDIERWLLNPIEEGRARCVDSVPILLECAWAGLAASVMARSSRQTFDASMEHVVQLMSEPAVQGIVLGEIGKWALGRGDPVVKRVEEQQALAVSHTCSECGGQQVYSGMSRQYADGGDTCTCVPSHLEETLRGLGRT